MIIDYHIHTKYSDGNCSHRDIVNLAIEQGVSEIGFTDHYGIYPNEWTASEEALPALVEEVLSLKEEFKDRISILLGLEVDYYPEKEEETKAILSKYPFDYLMGSIHFVGGDNFDSDPNHPIYAKYSIDTLYEMYYDTLIKAINSGMFTTMSHLDLIKKYNYVPSKDLSELYYKIARLLVEKDIMVEYNTSGYSRPCKDFFPSDEITSILIKEGVKFTIGSDTHTQDHLLRNYAMAKERFKKLGLKNIYRYGGKAPISIDSFMSK